MESSLSICRLVPLFRSTNRKVTDNEEDMVGKIGSMDGVDQQEVGIVRKTRSHSNKIKKMHK
jgi:hypothetical protein